MHIRAIQKVPPLYYFYQHSYQTACTQLQLSQVHLVICNSKAVCDAMGNEVYS